MKLYAQHGYGPGDKLNSGLSAGVLDGVVLGAKDTSKEQIDALIAGLKNAKPDADILFDPHYYASILPRDQDYRLGNLKSYPYWGDAARNDLFFLDQANIQKDLRQCLEYQNTLPLSAFIAPNIVVRQTLNSRDGVSASLFINHASVIADEVNAHRPVLATIALSREALLDSAELERFVQIITSLKNPPNGFYVLLALSGPLNSELFHADVIANLLFLVSSLKLNGFEVVMGYSDLIGPILAIAGLDAGCSGWFQTLRMFSLNRFEAGPGGGKPPRPSYLSRRLFNRIFVSELLPAVIADPNVQNGFASDDAYFIDEEVKEPETKAEECIQSWDTLQRLQNTFSAGTQRERLKNVQAFLQEALALYKSLRRRGLSFELKSSETHLEPALEGIAQFQRNL
jgi:hypothetical protein